MNIFESLTARPTIIASETNLCANDDEACTCDLEKNLLACNNKDTLHNTNLTQFKNLFFDNFTRLKSDSFEGAHFASPVDSLSLSQIKLIQSDSWYWTGSVQVKHLHLTFTSDIIVEPSGFDFLTCNTLLLTCLKCQNNQAISLNNFGENTKISHLILDYETIVNSTNSQTANLFKNKIDLFNKLSDYNQNSYDEYWSAWYTQAEIEHIFVKNAKGIHVLDYKFVPNFKNLNEIKIVNTDLSSISETFSFVHSTNLKR